MDVYCGLFGKIRLFLKFFLLKLYPSIQESIITNPANIYLFKVNNRRRSGIFIDNFEHISHLFLVFYCLL